MHRKDIDMLHGPLGLNLMIYSLPIIFTSYLQLLFNAADLVVVGQYCGSTSVASVGATSAITNLIINLFMGLSVGAGVAVAHAIGSGQQDSVHRTVHTAMLTALLGGILLTVIGVTCSPLFLRLMRTPEDLLPLSSVYMRIYFGGISFTLIYNFTTSILRAAGDTRSPLIILFVSGIVNVVLNVIFVTALDMNVAGVALATVISQILSAIAVVAVLMKRTDCCRFSFHSMHLYSPEFMKIVRIGIPAAIQGAMFSISNVIIQSAMNSFGGAMVSGNSAASSIEGFLYATVNAFHQTAVNYIGQNHGARQYDRVKKISLICVGYAALAGSLVGGLAYVFREPLLRIYITDSPEAIVIGSYRMLYTSLPYFVYGILDVVTGSLRGIGASMLSMVLSVIGICGVRLLWLSTFFQKFHTPACLYASYIVSWVITLAFQFAALVYVYRKLTSRPAIKAAP